MTHPANEQPKLDLEPCPFCGQDPVLICITEGVGEDPFEREHGVRCDACAIAVFEETRDDAIERWNTRSALIARVQEGEEKGPTGDWVLVPREPTEAMLDAYAQSIGYENSDYIVGIDRAARAMIAASPSTPKAGDEGAVAWRVKDFADGWLLFATKPEARRASKRMSGALYEPLYASPLSGISREALIRLIASYLVCVDGGWPLHDNATPADVADAILKLTPTGASLTHGT